MNIVRLEYKWVALVVVAVGVLMVTLDEGAVRIVLPELARVFDAVADDVVWVLLIYLLVGAGLMFTLGWLGDVFGRKRVYISGLLLFTVGLGLSSVATGLGQLIAFRGVQAIGGAMMVSMSNAIVAASFPAGERGRALGFIAAVVAIGLLAGPAIGGALVEWIDWRAVFYLRIPVGVVAVLLAVPLLKRETVTRTQRRFDRSGATTLFLGLCAILLGINRGQDLGWFSVPVLGLIAAGALLLVGFVRIERNAFDPVLDLSLFSHRAFTSATINNALLYASTITIAFTTPFLLLEALSLPPSVAGLLLATVPGVRVLVSPLAGRLSDRAGPYLFILVGLLIVAGSAALMLTIDLGTGVWWLLALFAMLGVGMGVFVAPNTSVIMGAVTTDQLGTASAMVATSRQVGHSVGLVIAGAMFAHWRLVRLDDWLTRGVTPEVASAQATLAGFHATVIVAVLLALAGVVLLGVRREDRHTDSPEHEVK